MTISFFTKPAIREVARPQPLRTLEERQAELFERARRKARHEAESKRLGRLITTAGATVGRIEQELARAREQLAQLQVEDLSNGVQYSHADSQSEWRLRAGASALIDHFITEAWAAEDAARAPGVLQIHEKSGHERSGEWVPARTFTNAASVDRHLEALGQACRVAETLKLEAIGDAELRARLEALRDGIPPIEPLMVPTGDLLTPAEAREAAWSREAAGGDAARGAVTVLRA